MKKKLTTVFAIVITISLIASTACKKKEKRSNPDVSVGKDYFPEITFTKAGNYYYRVTHVSGMRSSATYDSTVYDVHVTVVKKDGELMYEVAIRKHGQEQPKYDECLFIDHFPGSGGSVTATPYRQPTPTPRPTEAPAEGIRVIINQLDGECFE